VNPWFVRWHATIGSAAPAEDHAAMMLSRPSANLPALETEKKIATTATAPRHTHAAHSERLVLQS